MARVLLVAIYRDDGSWKLEGEHVERIRKTAGNAFGVLQAASDADAAARMGEAEIVFGWRVSPRDATRATRLKWIQATSAGVEGMLFPELSERGIILTSAVGIHAIQISEQAMCMMVALVRKYPALMRRQAEGVWFRGLKAEELGELCEKTLVIVGLGHIGEALAVRAKAFGMRVVGIKRSPKGYRGAADRVIGIGGLGDALAEADFVVALLPNTPATAKAISAPLIARMKPTAFFLNFGRGAAVDENALVLALSEGKIAGAGLDVFEHEPLAGDSPLWRMENVIITPHVAGMTPRYWERATALFCENLRRYMAVEKLLNVVTSESGY